MIHFSKHAYIVPSGYAFHSQFKHLVQIRYKKTYKMSSAQIQAFFTEKNDMAGFERALRVLVLLLVVVAWYVNVFPTFLYFIM